MPDRAKDASHDDPAEAVFATRLLRWVHDDLGIAEDRRLVRADGERALLSKFDEGFARRLHALLERMPGIFHLNTVDEQYRRLAAMADGGTLRVDLWAQAMRALLEQECRAAGIDDDTRQAFVRAGIDSVRAMLDVVLWSAPAVGQFDYTPASGEQTAYRDINERFGAADAFSRYYGMFEGRRVENHCPGTGFARPMIEQAWIVCTATAPPGGIKFSSQWETVSHAPGG